MCPGSLRLTQVLQSWNHFTTCFISLKTETLNSRLLWWVKITAVSLHSETEGNYLGKLFGSRCHLGTNAVSDRDQDEEWMCEAGFIRQQCLAEMNAGSVRQVATSGGILERNRPVRALAENKARMATGKSYLWQ